MKNAFRLTQGCAIAVLVLQSIPGQGQVKRQLTEVYRNNDFQLTGITVSSKNRLFVNFPRWSAEYLNGVVEAMPDGSSKPFPDESWNCWDLSPEKAANHFVCVQSVVVDKEDALWILDAAAPMLMSIVPGGPKLVKVDLKTSKVR